MSELIQTHDNRATIRWKLLTGASAMALTAYVASTALAKADDADRPTLWIELGGQMEQMQGLSSTPFTAPFMSPRSPVLGRSYSGRIDQRATQRPAALCLRRGSQDQFPAGGFRLEILRRHPLWPLAQPAAYPPSDAQCGSCLFTTPSCTPPHSAYRHVSPHHRGISRCRGTDERASYGARFQRGQGCWHRTSGAQRLVNAQRRCADGRSFRNACQEPIYARPNIGFAIPVRNTRATCDISSPTR